jgi:2-aminoadipate transaminase
MDADGMRIDVLERLLAELASSGARAKLIYTIPDAQNPTGISMSLTRRQRLLEVAAAHRLLVLEDAPYRGVIYQGAPIPSLYALAGDQHRAITILVGSFAKTIAPGLRIGYLVGPPGLIDSCVMLKQGEDFCTSGLIQLITERLIRDGEVARTVARLREVQGQKLAAMLAALERELGGLHGVQWTRPLGGLFVWLTLAAGSDTDALLERAIAEKVAFIPGRYFYPGECAGPDGVPVAAPAPRHELRLNFSDPPLDRIAAGIATLARLIRES